VLTLSAPPPDRDKETVAVPDDGETANPKRARTEDTNLRMDGPDRLPLGWINSRNFASVMRVRGEGRPSSGQQQRCVGTAASGQREPATHPPAPRPSAQEPDVAKLTEAPGSSVRAAGSAGAAPGPGSFPAASWIASSPVAKSAKRKRRVRIEYTTDELQFLQEGVAR
jgi:hypothetical protein